MRVSVGLIYKYTKYIKWFWFILRKDLNAVDFLTYRCRCVPYVAGVFYDLRLSMFKQA